MKNPPNFLLLIPLALCLSLGSIFMLKLSQPENHGTLLQKPLPDFTLPALSFSQPNTPAAAPISFSSAKLRHENIVLLNVFASWCLPCRAEHPLLMQLAQQNIKLYGLAYKDRPEDAEKFLNELGNPFIMTGLDETGKLGIDLGLSGVPETYLLIGGEIRYHLAGILTEEIWQQDIEPLYRNSEAPLR